MQDARRMKEEKMEMSRQVKGSLHMRWRGSRRGGDKGQGWSEQKRHGRLFQEQEEGGVGGVEE
jgi:hypothetical protein